MIQIYVRTPGLVPDGWRFLMQGIEEPKGWRILQLRAQQESDPQKLAAIIDQMNCLLDQHDRGIARRSHISSRSGCRAGSSQKFRQVPATNRNPDSP